MFALLDEHYSGNESDEITTTIQKEKLHRNIWAIIKSEAGDWELLDFKILVPKNDK